MAPAPVLLSGHAALPWYGCVQFNFAFPAHKLDANKWSSLADCTLNHSSMFNVLAAVFSQRYPGDRARAQLLCSAALQHLLDSRLSMHRLTAPCNGIEGMVWTQACGGEAALSRCVWLQLAEAQHPAPGAEQDQRPAACRVGRPRRIPCAHQPGAGQQCPFR